MGNKMSPGCGCCGCESPASCGSKVEIVLSGVGTAGPSSHTCDPSFPTAQWPKHDMLNDTFIVPLANPTECRFTELFVLSDFAPDDGCAPLCCIPPIDDLVCRITLVVDAADTVWQVELKFSAHNMNMAPVGDHYWNTDQSPDTLDCGNDFPVTLTYDHTISDNDNHVVFPGSQIVLDSP